MEPMEKMLRYMIVNLKEEVKLWRILGFILAAAVVIALFF